MTVAFSTSIDRPSSWSAYSRTALGYSVTSVASRWFFTRAASSLNQNRLIAVRILPLPGMPLGMTQSKAEMRSVATISSASPRS